MSIRIVLTDDHRLVREALCQQIAREPDITVVAEAGDGDEALGAIERTSPDVVVLDIALPGMNGIEIARQIKHRHPQVGIVALSGYSERMFVEEMLKAGARGYVVKSAGTHELFSAIRMVAAGKHFLCSDVTGILMNGTDGVNAEGAPPVSVLSAREREVLSLLANGSRAADIATRLGISVATVEVHRRNIKDKVGVRTTAELTRYAIRQGLAIA